ncbi:YitT family protein [candidate division WOR-3 bacterium]|nr:YitT family protein [candidate division WOR-3 bacterium]
MNRRILRELGQNIYIVVGSAVMAMAYNLFLIPHHIVPGGAGGVAMILNYFFATPVGLTILVINIPLFFIGIKTFGRSYGVKSLLGIAISSLLIDGFTYVFHIRSATDNPILACIFGGIMLGAGLGLVFRGGGSTGGSDIVGMVLNRYTNLSTGTAILVVDFVVISAAGICFGQFETALYGYLNLYLQTRAIDLVLEGLSYTRALFIISDSAQTVAQAITSRMNRGATVLNATGAYSKEAKDMVFSVMAKREVSRAREIVREADPQAFIIITDVYEVLGEGFKPRT